MVERMANAEARRISRQVAIELQGELGSTLPDAMDVLLGSAPSDTAEDYEAGTMIATASLIVALVQLALKVRDILREKTKLSEEKVVREIIIAKIEVGDQARLATDEKIIDAVVKRISD